MGLVLEYAGKSDPGCVRANNEDNFGYDARYGVFVVCDGMGGAAAGEVASKLAVDTVLQYFREAALRRSSAARERSVGNVSQGTEALVSAIQLANSKMFENAEIHLDQSGMGSTIVVALIEGNRISIGHVGDSRIYRIRKGIIQPLTVDHSFVMEQVRLGVITMEEAEHSAMQHVIMRALGSDPVVKPDLDDLSGLADDILLLATDGLTKCLAEDDILKIIEEAYTLEQACEGLILEAKERGGSDNITCLLVRMAKRPWYRRMFDLLARREGKPKWQDSF